MLIGELADALGVPPETVRFYERRGLLPEPQRAANGYRLYGDAALHRLRFIRTAQAAGLTLAEIRSITDIRDGGAAPCSHVGALLETKLAEVQQRQRHLAALEVELDQLLRRSRSLDLADCADDDVCHILNAQAGPPGWVDADDHT
jgi:DNA-binding transcriptional MerR regulator